MQEKNNDFTVAKLNEFIQKILECLMGMNMAQMDFSHYQQAGFWCGSQMEINRLLKVEYVSK